MTEPQQHPARHHRVHRQRSGRRSSRPTLTQLEQSAPFSGRHIGPREDEIAKMLAVVGHGSLEELAEAAVPAAIRATERLDLPAAASEPQVLAELRALADRNTLVTPMIGSGYSGTHTPGVVLRNVMENPAWYTAYTPYQPEISQGRLEMLLNFQTVVARPHRPRRRGREPARRVHRRRRGDDAGPPAEQGAADGGVRRRRRDAPADGGRPAHPRAAARACRWRSSTSTDGLPEGDVVRRAAAAPGHVRRRPRPAPARRAGPRARRPGRRRRRPARPHPAREPRRARRGRRGRQQPALRRAAGLRRPARRLHGGAQGPRARHARAAGRRERRRRRRAGAAAGPADPRAAHPPREGDEQHLHRAGAARRHGRRVRRAPRPGRPAGHRPAHPPHRRRCSPPPCARAGHEPARRALLRHRDRARAGPRHAGRRRRRRRRASSCARVDADTIGISTDETTTRAHLDAVASAFGLGAQDWDALDAATPDALPGGAAPAPRRTSRTRSSAPTTARRRCCATCAGCPTRTSPSTGR